jgi:hypothetical protein
MEIEYEPGFLDEAVRRAVAAAPESRLYHRQRERAYREPDPELRARTFEALDREWFGRLGLDRELRGALAEQPLILDAVGRVGVGRPPHRRDAGAELLVRQPRADEMPSEARVLRLLLVPQMLLDGGETLTFLRRELLHVADMLDPRFGYEPALAAPGGPTHERLLRERYRAVWDVTVDGRLARAGRLDPTVRAPGAREFGRAFPGLDAASAGHAFARFFDDPAPTHAAIVAFVVRPGACGEPVAGACALCGFPTTDPEPDPAGLLAAAGRELVRDFPAWRPEHGCCRQCADLYRAASLSRAAAATLPGIR